MSSPGEWGKFKARKVTILSFPYPNPGNLRHTHTHTHTHTHAHTHTHTHTHQCSKLPVAYSPLATNFSRWRPPTCDLVAKKKKKKWKIEQSRIFRKEGGQIGSEHSFFHSSASVWLGGSGIPLPPSLIEPERNTDRETPTCHAYARCYSTEQYSAEPAQQVLSTCAVVRSTTERQNYTISQYTTRKQIYVSYIATSRKKADGSRADILFLSVSVRSRARHG